MKIITPVKYMVALDWDDDTLQHAKKHLKEWDSQSNSFYQEYKKIHKDFDFTEREHYRNCIDFWEQRLKK